MAGTALLGRLTWQLAELVEVVVDTPRVKTLVFDVPGWPGHRAGQHVDVRLTAEDGIGYVNSVMVICRGILLTPGWRNSPLSG
jgi:hypothetical protein